MGKINQNKFIKAFIESKGNLSTKDFIKNGYTMEHFIRYTQSNTTYFEMLQNLEKGIPAENKELLEMIKKEIEKI